MRRFVYFLALSFPLVCGAAAPSGLGGTPLSPVIGGGSTATMVINTNGTVIDANGNVINTANSRTAGFQEAIDSFPRVTDIFSGAGGGKLVVKAKGSTPYVLQTNVWIPNYFPFDITIEGGGFLNTRLRLQNSTNILGAFRFATNAVNGLLITNAGFSEISGIGFESESLFATNCIFYLQGYTRVKIHDCLFTTAYGVTNGQGAYTLSYEANVPNAPAGMVGIIAASSVANAHVELYNNWFYCLASSYAGDQVYFEAHGNKLACIGIYNSTPPPANNFNTIHFATNLWRGTTLPLADWISSGASFIIGAGTSSIENNDIFGSGAIGAVFSTSTDSGGTASAQPGDPAKFLRNRHSVVKYRIMSPNDSDSSASWEYEEALPSSGDAVLPLVDDVVLTNRSTSGFVWQPDPTQTNFSNVLPLSTLHKTGINSGLGSAPSQFVLNRGQFVGDGGGLTNLPAGAGSIIPGITNIIGGENTFLEWTNSGDNTAIVKLGADANYFMIANYTDAKPGNKILIDTIPVGNGIQLYSDATRFFKRNGTTAYSEIDGDYFLIHSGLGADYIIDGPNAHFQLPGIHQTDGANIITETGYNIVVGADGVSKFIGNGSGLTNVPPGNTNFTTYAAGTAYTLTGSSAALDFGTTDPVVTINQAGTYLIQGNVGIKYSGTTYAGAQTVTLKFRRTNNTAADLSNGSRAVNLPVLTTFTGGDVMALPPVIYTATSGDTVTIFGILSATPAAGSVLADTAEIVAIRLY